MGNIISHDIRDYKDISGKTIVETQRLVKRLSRLVGGCPTCLSKLLQEEKENKAEEAKRILSQVADEIL